MLKTNSTHFNSTRHHIYLNVAIQTQHQRSNNAIAILDTGAPRTEFSDRFLSFTKIIEPLEYQVNLNEHLQTKKHTKVIIPKLNILGHSLISRP